MTALTGDLQRRGIQAQCIGSPMEPQRAMESPMKRKELEAAVKAFEGQAGRLAALTAAISETDPKLLEDASAFGGLSAAINSMVISHNEINQQPFQGLPLISTACDELASAFSPIDSQALEPLCSGLLQSSIAAALDQGLEDTTDEQDPAIQAPVTVGSPETKTEAAPTPNLSQTTGSSGTIEPGQHGRTDCRLAAMHPVENRCAEVARRKLLLDEYKSATGNPSNKRIYEARNACIHKPQFYEWLRGELPANSQTTTNFERLLSEKKLPIPRKPRP